MILGDEFESRRGGSVFLACGPQCFRGNGSACCIRDGSVVDSNAFVTKDRNGDTWGGFRIRSGHTAYRGIGACAEIRVMSVRNILLMLSLRVGKINI